MAFKKIKIGLEEAISRGIINNIYRVGKAGIYNNNNKFNLPSDLVPLIGPHRLIPIVKTQYIH